MEEKKGGRGDWGGVFWKKLLRRGGVQRGWLVLENRGGYKVLGTGEGKVS